ncbi:hypothetical protein HMPREF3190_00577 [Umbribacter vaginalis]|nr:hypothetical protein HMPREF3190_00577 [Coriobacteriales bacterium DNF00809]
MASADVLHTSSTGVPVIEEDLGQGYVRLSIGEAHARQAQQDIRSVEDIARELLRNAYDADAHNIFIALSSSNNMRSLLVLDDGHGIPQQLWSRIFEPRVTSKQASFHPDLWGMHGRGMALYSIAQQSNSARVVTSKLQAGSVIAVQCSLSTISEKADQSSFPTLEYRNDSLHVRGARNIYRCCLEFALYAQPRCHIFVGTPTEMLTTIYHVYAHACSHTSATTQSPTPCEENQQACVSSALIASLAQAKSVSSLHTKAQALGFDVSLRTARRVFDNTLTPQSDILQRALALMDTSHEQTQNHSLYHASSADTHSDTTRINQQHHQTLFDAGSKTTASSVPEHSGTFGSVRSNAALGRVVTFDKADLLDFQAQIASSFAQLAPRYYLYEQPPIHVQCAKNELRISIPLRDASETALSCTSNTQTSLL